MAIPGITNSYISEKQDRLETLESLGKQLDEALSNKQKLWDWFKYAQSKRTFSFKNLIYPPKPPELPVGIASHEALPSLDAILSTRAEKIKVETEAALLRDQIAKMRALARPVQNEILQITGCPIEILNLIDAYCAPEKIKS